MLEILLDLPLLQPALIEHISLALLLAEDVSKAEEQDQEDMLDDEEDRDELDLMLLCGWQEVGHQGRTSFAVRLERRIEEHLVGFAHLAPDLTCGFGCGISHCSQHRVGCVCHDVVDFTVSQQDVFA